MLFLLPLQTIDANDAKEMQNIYLIGFMGSGKSHIGRLLVARLTDYTFIDLDDYILQKSGAASISAIFESKGEAYFRMLETAALQDTLALRPAVVATGGGTACFGDNMQWMNENGLTVFLNPPIETIHKRLKNNRRKRPLLADLEDGALLDFIKNLLAQRLPYYTKAGISIAIAGEKAVLEKLLSCITY